jgi:hypothetical protein
MRGCREQRVREQEEGGVGRRCEEEEGTAGNEVLRYSTI